MIFSASGLYLTASAVTNKFPDDSMSEGLKIKWLEKYKQEEMIGIQLLQCMTGIKDQTGRNIEFAPGD